MRVLLLEGDPGAASAVESQLTAAGHQVSRCHDPGTAGFPCRGLTGVGTCPLESEHVDVAVVVRSQPGDGPSAGEDGVRCALRRFVPLVVAGEVSSSPYRAWAAVVHEGIDELATAVAEAASTPLRRHAEAATRSLREVLDRHGLDSSMAEAHVRRVGDDLRIMLRPNVPIEPAVAEMASVRAVGAVRALDPHPRVIDVTIEH
jgi:hypothetical protein